MLAEKSDDWTAADEWDFTEGSSRQEGCERLASPNPEIELRDIIEDVSQT